MPFTPPSHTPYQWQNAPSTNTPLDAAHLDAAETDLVTYTQQVANLLGVAATNVKTANYIASGGDFVPVDATSGSITVTLPSAPSDQTRVGVKLVVTASGHTATVARGGADVFNKTGGSTSLVLTQANQSCLLQYQASTNIWHVHATDQGIPPLSLVTGVTSNQVLSTLSVLDGTSPCVDDCITITDAAIASIVGNAQVSSTQHPFTTSDVGKKINVQGAGPGSTSLNVLSATINSVSGGVATLSTAATAIVSGATAWFGTDNTTNMQAFIAAAALAGRELLIPRSNLASSTGVYLTASLTYASNLTIRGCGGALQKFDGGVGQSALIGPPSISSGSVSNLSFDGLILTGVGQLAGFGGNRIGIQVRDGSNIRVKNCFISNFNYSAIQCNGGKNIWITDNLIRNCSAAGLHNTIDIEAFGGSTNDDMVPNQIVVRGNYVENSQTSAICLSIQQIGIGPYNLDALIEGNNVQSNAFDTIALELGAPAGQPTTGVQQHRISITNNLVKQTSSTAGNWGIGISDNHGSGGGVSTDDLEFQDISVTGNTVISSANGIVTQSSYCLVANNIIELSTAAFTGISVVNNTVNHPTDVVVNSNLIHLPINGGDGISVSVTSSVQVTGNRIKYDSGSSLNNGSGIDVHNGSTNVNVVGNSIAYSPGPGINFNGCGDFTCVGNKVRNAADANSQGATGSIAGINSQNTTITNAGMNLIQGNTIIDDRVTPIVKYIFLNGGTGTAIDVIGNVGLGHTFASPINGTFNQMSGNDFGTSSSSGFDTASITPGASPYTFVNTSASSIHVTVQGGTVSQVKTWRGGTGTDAGVTAGRFMLGKGDQITVTYTVVPTMAQTPVRIGG